MPHRPLPRAGIAALFLAALVVGGAARWPAAWRRHAPAVVAVQEVRAASVPIEFEYPAQTAGSREVRGARCA
jgi:hypothetical protein